MDKKVSLSDDKPHIQHARKKLIGGVDPDFIIKQAEDFVRPRTPEEIEQAKKSLKYPGLPPHMRVRKHQPEITFFGIQIRIGWWN